MVMLEKYRGSRSRHTCPSCGHKKEFARYIDENGDYFSDEVGRCNRESSCGYHLTPKEWRGVQCSTVEQVNKPNKLNTVNGLNTLNKLNTAEHNEPDFIDNSFVVRSLEHTAGNRLLNYLAGFIDTELIAAALKKYLIGTTKDGRTVFWQIDRKGRARTGKIISYHEETGKRDKSRHPSWIHYELKRHGLLSETFQHRLCFFGEHMLRKEATKPIAVVEAEKTALIASIFIDDYVWLAVGGKSYLKAEKLQRFGQRKIVLFPDADGFELWSREAAEAQKLKLNVEVSEAIEKSATDEERKAGFDLADYLIRAELHAQKWNADAEAHERRMDIIAASAELSDKFNEFCDERAAFMEIEIIDTNEIVRIAEYFA